MNAKEAITLAKREFAEVFQDENLRQIGLEEIEFDDKEQAWRITLGFYRAEITQDPFSMTLAKRIYKILSIDDRDGKLISVKNREPADA